MLGRGLALVVLVVPPLVMLGYLSLQDIMNVRAARNTFGSVMEENSTRDAVPDQGTKVLDLQDKLRERFAESLETLERACASFPDTREMTIKTKSFSMEPKSRLSSLQFVK